MSEKKTFDPKQYLIKVKGKDYLQVVHRVHWFRLEKPSWAVKTEIVKLDTERGIAIVKAEVINDKGAVISSGHKMEYQKNFFDFVEKAETGSIGRALAALGYGTLQSAGELDEGIEAGRIVDAPVQIPQHISRQQQRSPERAGGGNKGGNGRVSGNGNGKSTGKVVSIPPEEINRAIERW